MLIGKRRQVPTTLLCSSRHHRVDVCVNAASGISFTSGIVLLPIILELCRVKQAAAGRRHRDPMIGKFGAGRQVRSARRRPGGPGGRRMTAVDTTAPVRQNAVMSIPVSNLNHAVLFVRDASVAAEFYGRVFGFEIVANEMGGKAIFMRAAGGDNHHDLGLFSVGPDAPRAPRGSTGLYHLAWEVPSIEDLADASEDPGRAPAPSVAPPTTVSRSRSTAATPTATSSRSCGASRAMRGASTRSTARSCPSTSTPRSTAGAQRPDRRPG